MKGDYIMANKILVLDAGHGIKTPGKQTLASLGQCIKSGLLTMLFVTKFKRF